MEHLKEVSLIDSRGNVIRRVLVIVENGYFYVCNREEWEAAKTEGREPVCIGFPPSDLIPA
jgi:hypothetical protein